jgi:hypothetical protein
VLTAKQSGLSQTVPQKDGITFSASVHIAIGLASFTRAPRTPPFAKATNRCQRHHPLFRILLCTVQGSPFAPLKPRVEICFVCTFMMDLSATRYMHLLFAVAMKQDHKMLAGTMDTASLFSSGKVTLWFHCWIQKGNKGSSLLYLRRKIWSHQKS